MKRETALEELKCRVSNENLIKHSKAVEAIMKGLARHLKEDEDKWGLAGLLHDIDYERTINNPEKHGLVGARILEDMGVESSIVFAVKAHNDIVKLDRKRKMDKALYSADPLSGLIVAAALILPEKKLSKVDIQFIINRMDEKGFAKGANRDQIKSCTELELTLEEFIGIALDSMKVISDELGL
jgi:putative nucleotidyltransferase with HDIG domain